jgi:hypothetical protein
MKAKLKTDEVAMSKQHQAWVNEALAGRFRSGSIARLKKIAANARATVKIAK